MSQSNYNSYREAHIRLKLSGNAQKILAFHYVLSKMDPDWCWGPFRRDPEKSLHCAECGGEIYYLPQIEPEQIKILAKQIDETLRLPGSLKVKIKKFTKNPQCKMEPDLEDDDELTSMIFPNTGLVS